MCSDVVVRAYRQLEIDLQVLVHEDMRANFSVYPRKWQLRRPDSNIDHRRVLNLATFFGRYGQELPVANDGASYLPGDIVTWEVQNLPHIGIVSSRWNTSRTHRMIVHNIGAGQVLEDMLFDFPITGHYRYQPAQSPH